MHSTLVILSLLAAHAVPASGSPPHGADATPQSVSRPAQTAEAERPGPQPARKAGEESFISGGRERTYEIYVPATARPPAPLLVLLHGSGSSGALILSFWRETADREGIVLVAPNATNRQWWQLHEDGPQFFYDLVERIAATCAIDRRRVYLFGNSGGAVYALTLALLESEYFAAAAAHAGAWRTPKEYIALPHARRKIPVALFMGDRDEFFPLRSAFETEKALRKAGHATLLRVLRRHRHAYREVAPRVNEEAWQFLGSVSLNENPRYQSYGTDGEVQSGT